jgi:hypothetical protein
MGATMADPMGTAGAVKENILDVATKGGPKFMTRLQQLADATDRHEEAYEKLGIGQSALASFNRAQEKLAEAEALRTEADAMRSQAAKTLANADAESKAKAVEGDRIVASAYAQQRAVDKRMEHVETRERAAAEAIAKAERARAEAERVRGDLKGRTDTLVASLREIAAA